MTLDSTTPDLEKWPYIVMCQRGGDHVVVGPFELGFLEALEWLHAKPQCDFYDSLIPMRLVLPKDIDASLEAFTRP
jgi:hypothetical protein